MFIIGLGNPGHQYALTRHNLGFRVVEALVTTLGAPEWSLDHGVRFSTFADHWILEPFEYMNDSGAAVQKFASWRELSLEPSRLLLVHDDLDFPLGTVKLDHDRSAGGHRGIQSLIDVLHTQDFHRLRLGIGSNRETGLPAEAYVLQRFTDDERPAVETMIKDAVSRIRQFAAL